MARTGKEPPMSDYSVSEAKDSLPRLIRDAEAGQEVRLTRRGHPVAVLVGAQRYEELTLGRPSFAERYRAFRRDFDLESLDIDPDEIFGAVRDRDPGREFSW
jgi:prevent-host-death family protein